MSSQKYNHELLDFIQHSPTPFHAVAEMRAALLKAGFIELSERESWKLKFPAKYFVVRGDSSLVAFAAPDLKTVSRGIAMVGAHTDSPCLRVKPQPETEAASLVKFGVEIYGGVLLSTWFDRDLSIAGRVAFRTSKGSLRTALVDFEKPIAILPNLAIHLNREVNDKRSIQRQLEMPPILVHRTKGKEFDLRDLLIERLDASGEKAEEILGHELSFYDTQPPQITGLSGEFISSARLDNLLSCWVAVKSLIDSEGDTCRLVVCNDHEEVGSMSASGAQGPFLMSVLRRLLDGEDALWSTLARSLFVSADNAHALHPNYLDRHDPGHAPLLNGGPAIKINATQRYATTSETEAYFESLCQRAEVPVQRFVARSDMGCGSTIGPITSSVIGVRTVDVGIPTFAMHSIREVAGAADPERLGRVFGQFFSDSDREAD